MSWRLDRRGFSASTKRLIMRRFPVCADCGVAGSVDADHVTPLAEGGANTADNGQGLCSSCHARKTAAETARGRARMNPRRPPEVHPGFRP